MNKKNLTIILMILLSINFVFAANFNIANVSNPLQSYLFVNGSTGNIGIGTTSPVAPLTIQTKLFGSNWAAIRLLDAIGNTTFWDIGVVNSMSNPDLIFYSSNGVPQITFNTNGNVGIGTTSPGRELHIKSDGGSQIRLESNYTASWDGIEINNSNYGMYFGMNENSGRFFIDTAYNGEDLTILQNGNVGIGTSNPSYGKLEISDNASNTKDFIHLSNTNDASRGAVFRVNGSSGAGNFMISTDGSGYNFLFGINSVEKMRLASSGSVGIGTTSPSSKLDVLSFENSAWSTQIQNLGSTNANGLYVNIGENSTGVPFRVDKNGSVLFHVSNNGNVGIGTTNPQTALHISQADSTNQLRLERTGTSSGSFNLNVANYFSIYDNTAGIERIRIDINGNVGIGTINPQGRLDVNGAIYQRGGSLHADYVFESNYTLESIENHSIYMWENKHLPAIPGKTVDSSGQEIVEMGARNKGIVEELEKAHVYIGQLNNNVKELKQENDELKNALCELNSNLSICK